MIFRFLTIVILFFFGGVAGTFAEEPDFEIDPIEEIPFEEEIIEDVQLEEQKSPAPAPTPVSQPVVIPASQPAAIPLQQPVAAPVPQPVPAPQSAAIPSQPVPAPFAAIPAEEQGENNLVEVDSDEIFGDEADAIIDEIVDTSENVDAPADDVSASEGSGSDDEFFFCVLCWIAAAIVARTKKAVVFYDVKDYGEHAIFWIAVLLLACLSEIFGDNVYALIGLLLFVFLGRTAWISVVYNKSLPLGLIAASLKMTLIFFTIPLYVGVKFYDRVKNPKYGCLTYTIFPGVVILGTIGKIFMNGKEFYTKKGWEPYQRKKLKAK